MSRISRHKRIRSKIEGTTDRPRLAVFRSNKNLYLQAIDDKKGITLASSSTLKDSNIVEAMYKKLSELKITKVVFDRGGFAYHGKIKQLAEDLRKQGLEF